MPILYTLAHKSIKHVDCAVIKVAIVTHKKFRKIVMKKIMMLVGCSFVFTSYAMEQSQSATSPTSDKQSVFPVVKIDVPSSSVRIIKPIAIRLGTIDISSPVQEAASLLMKLHLSSSRMPALHQAAVSGDADSVKQLLNQGSNCNAVDGTGTSPLAYALEKGHYKTAFIL